MSSSIILSILFIVVALFSAISFGKVFQMRTHYNINSPSATIVVGLPIYFLSFFVLLLPTLFVAMTPTIVFYYFITVLSIILIVAIICFVKIRKLLTRNLLDWFLLFLLFFAGSILLILPNINSDFSVQEKILVNDAFDRSLFNPFNERSETFLSAWIRMLSGWLTLFSSTTSESVYVLTKITIPILFSLYFFAIILAIGKDVLRWKRQINRILAPILYLALTSGISILGLDVALGFMFPLLVLLTGVVLFFFRTKNIARGRGISILISLMFNLAFLFDYNTWVISLMLGVALNLYQGFRFRAIGLRDVLLWILANTINLVFIFSNSIEAVIAITVTVGFIGMWTVKHLSSKKFSHRFVLENRIWRNQLLLFFISFTGLSISSLVLSSQGGLETSFYYWLNPEFWGDKFDFSTTWAIAITGGLGVVVLSLVIYSYFFFTSKVERTKNHLMIIVASIVILFFNPLVAPMYQIADSKNAYFYGFIFLAFFLFIAILNFFKEIQDFKESKFLSITPILSSLMLALISYLGYLSYIARIKIIKPTKTINIFTNEQYDYQRQRLKYKR